MYFFPYFLLSPPITRCRVVVHQEKNTSPKTSSASKTPAHPPCAATSQSPSSTAYKTSPHPAHARAAARTTTASTPRNYETPSARESARSPPPSPPARPAQTA